MIEVRHLTKHYGPTVAVDDLSFTVRPGTVTGFLGPNGAGKTTAMKMILGLETPTSGEALVNGRTVNQHDAPLTQIGALLDAKAIHARRSARDHLRALAATTDLPDSRVDDVLDIVGLTDVADRIAGGFSLGMGQRLGIAAALLGDPSVVMLDEPVNGLDPSGVLWIRHLARELAAQGRTVLISSHLMSEMALTADRFVIVGKGRLIADVSLDELLTMGGPSTVTLRSSNQSAMREALMAVGADVVSDGGHALTIVGRTAAAIGKLAHDLDVTVSELTTRTTTLEQTFMQLTHDSVEYDARLDAA